MAMRVTFWALITLSALSGCANPTVEGKPARIAALNGKQEVRLRLAHATEDGGDFAGAEKMFRQVVHDAPDAVAPHVEMAGFYHRHHADPRAIDDLNAALKLEPGNTDIARELANTYIGLSEPDKALGLLDQAIARNRTDPLLFNSRGVALDQLGNYREAQNSYKKAYDLDTTGGTTYKINISMSYILSGEYDKAIAVLRPMLMLPDPPPIIRQNLALAYGLKGDTSAALDMGLQDLSSGEAEENLRFYRMLLHDHNGGIAVKAGAATVPASDIKDLFSENDSAVTPAPFATEKTPKLSAMANVTPSAIAAPVHIHDTSGESMPLPIIKAALTPSVSSAAAMSEETSFPEPVLKPDRF